MILQTDPAALVDLVSGILFMALGLWVLTIRPRLRANVALAAFSVALGATFVAWNLLAGPETTLWLVVGWVTFAFALTAAVALVALMLLQPRPLQHHEIPLALGSGAMALFLGFLGLVLWPPPGPYVLAWRVLHPAFWFGLLLLPLRFAYAGRDEDEVRRRILLTAVALLPYPAIFAGGLTTFPSSVELRLGFAYPGVGVMLLASLLWLRNIRLSGKGSRNLALATLAMPLAGMLLGLWTPGAGQFDGPPGLARIATVLILTYAILRAQLLGVDVKVKWTLKQSTVAAVFIGLFFVVSEAAAAFFSDQVGTYLGIVAAGALVFAIAPLQHFAQRVADRAMPGVKAVGEMTDDERVRLFREMAEAAWADGALTRDERRMLGELREKLHLDPAEAEAIEREVTG